MHADKARRVGTGLAGGAFTVSIVNMLGIGGNPNGLFTFLYIGIALGLIASAFMILVFVINEHKRDSIMHHKMVAIGLIIIFDIVFAIPHIQWIFRFIDLGDSSATAWIIRWTAAIVLQVFATIMFITYSRMHVQGGSIGGYIAAPHGVAHH